MNTYLALKAAMRDLVAAAGGNVRAAKVSRADSARLSRYGSPQESMHAPIDVISDLEQEVGDPIVTRILADRAGFVLVPKATLTNPVPAIYDAAAPVMKEVGDVLTKLGKAMIDGVVTPAEADEILPEAREASAQIHALEEALHARSKRGR